MTFSRGKENAIIIFIRGYVKTITTTGNATMVCNKDYTIFQIAVNVLWILWTLDWSFYKYHRSLNNVTTPRLCVLSNNLPIHLKLTETKELSKRAQDNLNNTKKEIKDRILEMWQLKWETAETGQHTAQTQPPPLGWWTTKPMSPPRPGSWCNSIANRPWAFQKVPKEIPQI